jgi:hypothetical protein
MRAQISTATTGGGGDRPAAPPGCPGAGPGGASVDRWTAAQVQSTAEFLCRFGDAIDDRVADILDEREALRPRSRPSPGFAAFALLLAVIATILMRHAAVAVCTVWLSTAAVCLAAWTTRPGRP